ncbi:MAG: helix-turn-helix domain-containing protein [Bacteroidia bacterium]
MELTFEQLPLAIRDLTSKVERIESLLLNRSTSDNDTDQLICIKETAKYLKLSVPTIYRKVSRGEIPYCKKSNRLYFSKSELIDWIKTSSFPVLNKK